MQGRTVAVIGGTGQQGRGIAQRLAQSGVAVVVGSRDPARAAATVAAWPAAIARVRGASYRDAIVASDVVILTVPFGTLDDLLAQHRLDFNRDALVVDVTVPVTFDGGTAMLAPVPDGSAAEHVRARLPEHVRVAAAFKTLPAHLLNDVDQPLDCDEFVCGDSTEARDRARSIVEMLAGLRAVDVGPLSRARAIEHLTLLAIAINHRHKIHEARFRVVGL
jgi:hypothetical protein